MADIVERLRAAIEPYDVDNHYADYIAEAADEIERLRLINTDLNDGKHTIETEIKRLRAALCNCPLPYRALVPEQHEESCPVVCTEDTP